MTVLPDRVSYVGLSQRPVDHGQEIPPPAQARRTKCASCACTFLEHKPVSQLCEEEGIHPTLFYQWQKAFFENGAAAFQRSPRTGSGPKRDALVEQLQARLQRKDEVIAEIAEDLIREKKANGAS